MASFAWNGGSGDYLDPTQWTPAGVPLYDGSDTLATITAGSVSVSGIEPNGITLVLGGPIVESQLGPVLTLADAALGPEMTLNAISYGTLDVESYNTSYGTIAIGSPDGSVYSSLDLSSRTFGQLNQEGTLTVGTAAELTTDRNTFLNNDRLIEFAGGRGIMSGDIIGTGTIDLAAPNSTLSLYGGVGPGQTIRLHQGAVNASYAPSFHATISGFTDSAATLMLGQLVFDTATYVQDIAGERLVLTNAGAEVGTVPLVDTPPTQYVITQHARATTISPAGPVYTDGSIPGTIAKGTVTIRNAEPNGQAVAFGGPLSFGSAGVPNLVLDNAALGPGLTLTIGRTDAADLDATLTVQGDDTAYGQIDVGMVTDPSTTGGIGALTIILNRGSQLNQEGTISVAQAPPVGLRSALVVQGDGTLNNDGQIIVGGAFVDYGSTPLTGSGTVTIDGGSAQLTAGVASTQTVDLLRGTLRVSSGSFLGTIKDWSSTGTVSDGAYITSVQFNQTSAVGGDLQVFSYNGKQIGDLNLLGTYATLDFSVAHDYVSSTISLVPPA